MLDETMREIVLVGAGHTHLHIVREWGKQPIAGTRLTLVSEFAFAAYSGMLPGTLAELYAPDEMLIDLDDLCSQTKTRIIVDQAAALDSSNNTITLQSGKTVSFDIASIGIGSVPAGEKELEINPRVIPIKPMQTFLPRLEAAFASHLDRRINRRSPVETVAGTRVAIVGGGAAGVEIAFCLNERLFKRGISAEVVLYESGEQILPWYSKRTVAKIESQFLYRGIETALNHRVERIADDHIHFNNGSTATADIVIWITGAAPPSSLECFDLRKSDSGFLATENTLQTTSGKPVFAVGDTGSIIDEEVPKAGVYAVRQGPVLWNNLKRLLAGQTLERYRPQGQFLSLMATGDETAILEYRGWSFSGKWCWKLKDHIDRSFVKQFRS